MRLYLMLAFIGLAGIPGAQAAEPRVAQIAVPKEYSVWLVPSGHERDALKTKIAALSKKYGTPAFEPHVTLIGLGAVPGGTDASVAAAVEAWAGGLEPFTVSLKELGYSDKYFRSFFAKVDPTPDVMAAGAKGLELYRALRKQAPPEPVYFPHLSLLYGDLPAAKKERMFAEDFGGARAIKMSFVADRVQLWVTNEKPKTWRLVKEYRLAAKVK